MLQRFHRSIFFLILLLLHVPAFAADGLAIDPHQCIECHSDVVTVEVFAASVHSQNACTSCHTGISDLKRHTSGEEMPGAPECVRCHKKETAEHYASVHMLNDITCADCHHDLHSHRYWQEDKRIAVAKCTECHPDTHDVYANSIHGTALEAGNMDSAACFDCHGLHEIKPLGDPTSHENREFHTRVCMVCHADREMMDRSGVNTVAVSSYMASYHGKNYRLGYPELVAGCADCHTSHGVLPASHEDSTVHPNHLVETCAQCHPGATPLFAQFYSHGDHSDRENYPILYWTFVVMTSLLLSVFAIFWIHTMLWMFRGFVENREKKAALIAGHVHVIPGAHTIYRRFNRLHIFLHLLVIISFLGLSLTGLPLKFADQAWARILMGWYGGAANAAFLHRIGAVITFVYFAAAIAMSFHFLFIRKDIKGIWLQRLFGPDSLCPNLRDIQDVSGMVRWFLFRGPKPTFERWTYWEKFDFLAVFWGMFAIGGSGLMLWFPEFFGLFLPGWFFNVATIVHSDEALLATGFIFTVHFFNTHGRPEKFPMDFVIFNGEMSKEEFIEERGDQWRRYEEEGITEQFRKERPSSVIYDFFIKGFGFTALFIGLGLLALMVYAFLAGGHMH
jgi:hypothetical protein